MGKHMAGLLTKQWPVGSTFGYSVSTAMTKEFVFSKNEHISSN